MEEIAAKANRGKWRSVKRVFDVSGFGLKPEMHRRVEAEKNG